MTRIGDLAAGEQLGVGGPGEDAGQRAAAGRVGRHITGRGRMLISAMAAEAIMGESIHPVIE